MIGTFRSSPEKGRQLLALGAEVMALDLLDAPAVRAAVLDARPEAIVHQATALAGRGFSRKLDRTLDETSRLRTEGTHDLLAAARAAGVHRFVAQSFAPTATPGKGNGQDRRRPARPLPARERSRRTQP